MLAPPKGNLSYVRQEVERLRMVQQYEADMTDHALNANLADAEISDGEADWYLVHTFPGDDLRAMRWLARRRFGVFRPMQQRKQPHREGQPIGVMEAVFPGWLFVFTWMSDSNWNRLRGCPGVMGLLCQQGTQKPVPIIDGFVQELRAKAWCIEDKLSRLGVQAARNEEHTKKKAPLRPNKTQRKALDRLKEKAKTQGVTWDQSTLAHLNDLDPHHRIAFMERILMPSDTGCAASVR